MKAGLRAMRDTAGLLVSTLCAAASTADAQPLGTFRWQLQPFCNVVTLAVTQNGGVFRLEGTDDQCGNGADQASAIGTAFQNPDGTIGFGVNLVVAPGGAPVHVDAAITLATLNGTWRDSVGNAGTFAFSPGAGTGGNPRPVPAPIVPATIQLLTDGGLLATGQAGVGAIPATGPGTRLMWHPAKAAFRAGQVNATAPDAWDDPNVGVGSTALGLNSIASGLASFAAGDQTQATSGRSVAVGFGSRASGFASTAMGNTTTASGSGSTAIGVLTIASGAFSTAMGRTTVASGFASFAAGDGTQATNDQSVAVGLESRATGARSTAMGERTTASGPFSTAMGQSTIASGPVSTAIGFNTTASGFAALASGDSSVAGGTASLAAGQVVTAAGTASVALGSFVSASTAGTFMFGDRSSTTPLLTFVPNQFLVRAAGGTAFYSNNALSAGVQLDPGAGSWSTVSDVTRKQHFRDLSGEDVLAKLAGMAIQEWSYKAQDASIRHVGPTAQEFHGAFGLGEDPLRISTVDADGIAMRAIQALNERDRAHADEVAAVRAEVAALQALELRGRSANATQASEIETLRAMVEALTRQLTDAVAALRELKARP